MPRWVGCILCGAAAVLGVSPPTIRLKGGSSIKWYSALGPFEDPGVVCMDPIAGELPRAMITTNPTSAKLAATVSKKGKHTIEYRCRNYQGLVAAPVKRTVDTNEKPGPNEPPVIDLLGSNPLVWSVEFVPPAERGKNWFPEPGMTCLDPSAGEVNFNVSGNEGIQDIGKHIITYKCTAVANGQVATRTRTVVTVGKLPLLQISGPNPDTFTFTRGHEDNYDDPGASCFSVTGKDISNRVQQLYPSFFDARGPLDPPAAVQYTCEDADGRSAKPVFRRVNIVEKLASQLPKPKLTINGPPVVHVVAETPEFEDEGATCIDDVDGEITDIDTEIPDVETPGKHVEYYTCQNSRGGTARAQRIIMTSSKDVFPPKLVIHGPKTVHLTNCGADVGGRAFAGKEPRSCTYHDAGVTCTDKHGNVLPAKFVDVSLPDLKVLGEHFVFYHCKDKDGVPALPVYRQVIVNAKAVPSAPAAAPHITLYGPKVQIIPWCDIKHIDGYNMEEDKVTCTDVDGKDITGRLDFSTPDPTTLGKQEIAYHCVNAAGVAAPVAVRHVLVEKASQHAAAAAAAKQTAELVAAAAAKAAKEIVDSNDGPKLERTPDDDTLAPGGRQVSWLDLLGQPSARPMLFGAVFLVAVLVYASRDAGSAGAAVMPVRRVHGSRENSDLMGTPDDDDYGDDDADTRRSTASVLERPQQNLRRRSSNPHSPH